MMRFAWFLPVWLVMTILPAHAQSPADELAQLSAQLRSNPRDTALRERIIRLALEIKPPPAVPEEAERRMARGQMAFKLAKEPGDFEKAIAEFSEATLAAPWLATPYYNLALTQEAAKRYRNAMQSFRLYLLASPGAPDASEVRQKIYSLEYLADLPPPPPKPATGEELLARLDGAVFGEANQRLAFDSTGDRTFEITGRNLLPVTIHRSLGPWDNQHNRRLLSNPVTRFTNMIIVYLGNLKWEDRTVPCDPGHPCQNTTYEVSPDGQYLTVRSPNFGASTYRRIR
jgi:tetratricopeptide (TPR) repeat protein